MKEPTLGNPQNTIAVLQKYNFVFQKKFGQNFLIDTHVLDKIIGSAEITKDDFVLEIGPGIGTMTQYLACAAGKVAAVEIDKALIPILEDTLDGYDNVQVINEDVLKVDIAELAKQENEGKPIKVVANLPYYITTPIIMGLFENHVPMKSITVMVQKEVADRMQVGPGTKDYGALSLAVQYYAKPYIVANVPPNFVRDVIMKAPSSDMMNNISRYILSMYTYDDKADDISIPNVLRQCLNLISQFPMFMVYAYHAYNYRRGEDLYIYAPHPELSAAENILMMLREDRKYTALEAEILDMALVLHMDHGGGNNSTFTTHVVTSSGTDTYSTITAAMASLKGPKHGGANVKVTQMFEDMKATLTDWTDEEQIRQYLEALLDKKAFDKKGLIYGMGHAVYSISDPRADVFRAFVKQLAQEKGCEAEYALYEKVEHMAPEVIAEKRKIYKGVSANVDFYSGLVYSMLDLPPSLYTPIFAAARIVGWSAHRLEELKNADKIIRPAYKPLAPHREYIKLDDR